MKQVIILLGPPGAGKGTQAELLSSKLDLYLFETSKILEEKFLASIDSKERFIQVGEEKYDVLNEKELWKRGELCSPPFVSYLVKAKLKKLFDLDNNLVIAGSPRTLFEAKEIAPFLKELYGEENIKIFLVKISPKETIFRNSHRRICELLRHPVLYNEETIKLTKCPLDGSKLMIREGLDDPETIKIRLKEYKERTFPLIDYLKEEGLEVKEINGEQSVTDVSKDIMKQINTNLYMN